MKILDLFNEYNLSPEMIWWEVEQPRTGKDWDTMSRMDKAYIVSKDFWWIKWLVDNNKIDKRKVFSFIDTTDKPYEDILCLLALSDEPIDDLISYLR